MCFDYRPAIVTPLAAINPAADFGNLIRIADENLIAIARIDQNAGEIPERKIAAADLPRGATVMRHVESLLCTNVNVVRSLWVLGYGVYRYVTRYAFNLPPSLAGVARNENS